jgi:hypothetical protein
MIRSAFGGGGLFSHFQFVLILQKPIFTQRGEAVRDE